MLPPPTVEVTAISRFFKDSPSNLAHSRVPVLVLHIEESDGREGTGTWPDYLVHRDDQKNEGPFGEKIAQKSRNSCTIKGRGCGCIGTVDSRCNLART